jgi:hypothetical protein
MIAAERDVSRAQVALAWLHSRPVVTAPLVGANTTAQIDDAVASPDIQLTGEEIASLERPYTPRYDFQGVSDEALTALHPRVFLIRPGFIRPCRGARPATRGQRAAYALLMPFYPLITRLYPGRVTTTDAIAYAILEVRHAPETVPRRLGNPAIGQVAVRGFERVNPPLPF